MYLWYRIGRENTVQIVGSSFLDHKYLEIFSKCTDHPQSHRSSQKAHTQYSLPAHLIVYIYSLLSLFSHESSLLWHTTYITSCRYSHQNTRRARPFSTEYTALTTFSSPANIIPTLGIVWSCILRNQHSHRLDHTSIFFSNSSPFLHFYK